MRVIIKNNHILVELGIVIGKECKDVSIENALGKLILP